jgi:hypothetical protein
MTWHNCQEGRWHAIDFDLLCDCLNGFMPSSKLSTPHTECQLLFHRALICLKKEPGKCIAYCKIHIAQNIEIFTSLRLGGGLGLQTRAKAKFIDSAQPTRRRGSPYKELLRNQRGLKSNRGACLDLLRSAQSAQREQGMTVFSPSERHEQTQARFDRHGLVSDRTKTLPTVRLATILGL